MKTHIYYITALTIAGFIIFYFYDKDRKSQAREKQYQSVITEKDAVIKYHVNDKGKIIAEKEASQISTKEFLDAYQSEAERLRNDMDIRTKNLRAYIQASFDAKGQGTGSVINNYYDSAGHKMLTRHFTMTDGYLTFNAIIDSTAKSNYVYDYQDSLIYAFHVKKKWLLAPEKFYGSGMLSNKNAKITNATNVLINDYKDKRWVISAGVGYDPFSNQFRPVVSLGYALFKF